MQVTVENYSSLNVHNKLTPHIQLIIFPGQPPSDGIDQLSVPAVFLPLFDGSR